MKILNLLLYFCFGILILSCSNERESNKSNEEFEKSTFSLTQNGMLSSDTLFIHIERNNYDLKFSSAINQGVVTSELTIYISDSVLFKNLYVFDTTREYWKLYQSDKIEQKSNTLKTENIPSETLAEIVDILTDNIGYIYNQTIDIKDPFLISSINYHKSIINTTLRSIQNNEECNCTVHPEFLLDKAFFNCQEEHFYDTEKLKDILNQYVSENDSIDSSTTELINYLSSYQEDKIRFDEYYSFYVSSEDFNLFIDYLQTNGGGCGWYCPIGCGSDHGCCGNYSGCCIYRHILCYIHDKMCITCDPPKFCLPGCVPDTPKFDSVTIN